METPEPDPIELNILSLQGRLDRMINDEGLDIMEAMQRITLPESAQDYACRNEQAMRELEKRLLDPGYIDAFAEAMSERDETIRAQKLAALQRETFRLVDIEAVHRMIRARNRQWKAEGILPPDAQID